MAVFFLVVGLEIKREVLVGELATMRKAILPLTAALGGAVLPAVIFLALNAGGDAARGWGIPMATDIAFALGVLALLGSRAPIGLKLFLTALAIADDLLAVVVIAVFYTADLQVTALAAAGGILLVLLAANRLGVRRPAVYALLGVALWIAVYESGVHATIAGVLLAFTIPSRTRVDAAGFSQLARRALGQYEQASATDHDAEEVRNAALWDLEAAAEQAQAPMQRMEHSLHPYVSYLIVPLFALANAGVRVVGADPLELLLQPLPIGIVLGLVVGKQVGITLATWAVVRTGRAELPTGVSMRHIYGAAWLGGIGFTMSLFIAELAFEASPGLLDGAKLGILAASVVAGIGGLLFLRRMGPGTD
jgi:NhaA family Na+:H+ antiporter